MYKTDTKNEVNKKTGENFCYLIVGGAITNWRALEKSPILLSQ